MLMVMHAFHAHAQLYSMQSFRHVFPSSIHALSGDVYNLCPFGVYFLSFVPRGWPLPGKLYYLAALVRIGCCDTPTYLLGST